MITSKNILNVILIIIMMEVKKEETNKHKCMTFNDFAIQRFLHAETDFCNVLDTDMSVCVGGGDRFFSPSKHCAMCSA